MELKGTLKNVTICLIKMYGISQMKLPIDFINFGGIGVSCLNDIPVILPDNKYDVKYAFWAGSSGTNWNLNDSTGGNHSIKNIEHNLCVVIVPEKWLTSDEIRTDFQTLKDKYKL